MVEAAECYSCNSSLEWHGDIPDEQEDVLCYTCQFSKLESQLAALRAENERLRTDFAALRTKADSLDATHENLLTALRAVLEEYEADEHACAGDALEEVRRLVKQRTTSP